MAATIGPNASRSAKPMFRPRIAFSRAELAAYYRVRFPRLSQRGRHWRGPCPLHRGDGQSFSVNPETGCWFCFSRCGGGSLLDFEMVLSGADFKTALAAVHAIVGRPIPELARMTHAEWRAVLEAQKREEREREEAIRFAGVAVLILEDELE